MSSDHPIFAAGRAMLKAVAEHFDRLEAQVRAGELLGDQADERRAAEAAELAAHQHAMANETLRHQAQCTAREKELATQAAHLAEREAQLAHDRDRIYARERHAEERAAYLQQRLSGAA